MALLILVISLLLTVPAWAQDLGEAGAWSGFGQGMSRGLEQMQSGIIQQGLMQQRAEHDRQLRERQYQHELEMQRLRYGQDQRQRDHAAAARHFQESANQEHRQLTAESHALNQERDIITSRANALMRLRTVDPARYMEEVVQHNQQAEDHRLHVLNYQDRFDSYHKRYGITPPPEQHAPEQVQPSEAIAIDSRQEQFEAWAHDWKHASLETRDIFRNWLVQHPKEYRAIRESNWDPILAGRTLERFKMETRYRDTQSAAK